MTERLLQFIWQFQYFNTHGLETSEGEPIEVIFPGRFNHDQGPDFIEAKLRIGNHTWVGAIELHLHTSDWKKHQHQLDKNYINVILHVVWQDDGYAIHAPVLELQTRISKILLKRYEELMYSPFFIPCEKSIGSITDIIWKSWKERLLAERLLRKTAKIEACLLQNNHHWEETFWWLLARNYGIKVNAEAFEAMARSLPRQIILKHRHQLFQIEALLLGQAGLLNNRFRETYPRLLKKEYQFLKKKYHLFPIHHPVHFLRMRPGNFPTVRLAQLAMLLHKSEHLFSRITENSHVKEIREDFNQTASEYWNDHYRFDEQSTFRPKKPGRDMIDNVLVNAVIPMLFAYGSHHHDESYKAKAIRWLEETGPEHNSIIAGFQQSGIIATHAFDSQALIELKSEYCNKKRCLDCAVGNFLLKIRPSKN